VLFLDPEGEGEDFFFFFALAHQSGFKAAGRAREKNAATRRVYPRTTERENKQHNSRHARTNEGIKYKNTSSLFLRIIIIFFFRIVSRASQNEARSDDVSPPSFFLRSRIFVLDGDNEVFSFFFCFFVLAWLFRGREGDALRV
jgi:hypothetical protein